MQAFSFTKALKYFLAGSLLNLLVLAVIFGMGTGPFVQTLAFVLPVGAGLLTVFTGLHKGEKAAGLTALICLFGSLGLLGALSL